ncbi:MAG: tRNA pseudouridine(55) synthase TruB [Vicinamibacterales bacterium]
MDGLLIVDKPSGPTSHDVVSRVRRALRERRIGHTGTLDPMASGVLPLVVGRATRLARFLNGDKTYEATIRLGFETDTADAQGRPTGRPHAGPWPGPEAVSQALAQFRGTFLQQPPAFSAKKIDGQRSYVLARKASAGGTAAGLDAETPAATLPLPPPVRVTAYALDLLGVEGHEVRLRVQCSAGFYIRALATDLGRALGTGAHLTALRRTAAAGFDLALAVPLDRLEQKDGSRTPAEALIPMASMLAHLPAVQLTAEGVRLVGFGRSLGPAEASAGFARAEAEARRGVPARLLAPSGDLVAVAEAGAPGLLHPSVVLL